MQSDADPAGSDDFKSLTIPHQGSLVFAADRLWAKHEWRYVVHMSTRPKQPIDLNVQSSLYTLTSYQRYQFFEIEWRIYALVK